MFTLARPSAGYFRAAGIVVLRLIGIAVCMAFLLPLVEAAEAAIPILVYHRFGPVRSDSMTVTTEHFREQLDTLRKNNFTVIPLSTYVSCCLSRGPAPPARAIVLTFDDGHVSQYREAKSIILDRRLAVTLFLYPSCISNSSYAMTWAELRELALTSYFDVQSHTYWHPNFKVEAKMQSQRNYATFVDNQLQRSKTVLEDHLQRRIILLAWPFGIYDSLLSSAASTAGYEAAFSIDCRAATGSDPLMSLPRCLVSDSDVGPRFLRFIESAVASAK